MRIPRLFLLAGLAACARGEAKSSLGRVVVDTIGGKPRTITEAPVGWVDTMGWKLTQVARLVGGAEGPGDLIQPQSVSLGSDGMIYVADQNPAVVKVFTPEGRYLRSIGREGEGPGEFKVGYIRVIGGSLMVHDPQLHRTSVFDTEGKFIRSWESLCCYWSPLHADSSGAVGVPGPPPHGQQQGTHNPWQGTVRWYRMDGTMADSTLIPSGPEEKSWTARQGKGRSMSTSVPFAPGTQSGFLSNRLLVIGFSDHYQLAITARNGSDTVELFGRSWTAAEVPEIDRQGEIDRMIADGKNYIDERTLRNTFKLSDVPATAPAFDWMGVDGRGDLWIRTPVPADTTRSQFDVFDPAHRWLGQVSGSRLLRSWGIGISGDRVFGYGEDEEGNPAVVVYRIVRDNR